MAVYQAFACVGKWTGGDPTPLRLSRPAALVEAPAQVDGVDVESVLSIQETPVTSCIVAPQDGGFSSPRNPRSSDTIEGRR